jgi:polyvinyl alcohol dehydrogenase (cytochrome)
MGPVRPRSQRRVTVAAVALLLCTALAAPATAAESPQPKGDRPAWVMGGHDLANTRHNPFEHRITPANAASLGVRWSATTGDVSATPAVFGGAVYAPDWSGTLWKLDARTGATIWSRQIADYVGIEGALSRTSPAVVGHTLYLGTQQGARLLAVDTETGELRWSSTLDEHPAASLTQSPVVHDGIVYEGVSSQEEGFATDPNYACCTFRGSLVATDAATGRQLWKTSTIDDQGAGSDIFSGAAVWGGTPAIDPASRTVYVTTGNNYEVPAEAAACQSAGGTPAECLPDWNRINSVVALDLRTGRIKWSTGQDRFDSWNVSCLPGLPPNNCPVVPGPDHDFADGAHLFVLHGAHGPRPAVGAGQKSGEYRMLDARTGEVIWSAAVGPGGFVGGIQWGTASDGKRIYFTESDSEGSEYQLPDGRTITSSSFGALDIATGRILWQVAEPNGGQARSAVSTAGGVAYFGSMNGHMYALQGSNGKLLWDFAGEGSSNAGPAIVDGTVYWGNGYARLGGQASTKFYAFSVD